MTDANEEEDPLYIEIRGNEPKPKKDVDIIEEIQNEATQKNNEEANLERLRSGFRSVVKPFSLGFHVRVNEVLAERGIRRTRGFLDSVNLTQTVTWSYTPEEGYFDPNRAYDYRAVYERTKEGILVSGIYAQVNGKRIGLDFSDGEICSVHMPSPAADLLASTPSGAKLGRVFLERIATQPVIGPDIAGLRFSSERFGNTPSLVGYKYLPDKDEFSLQEHLPPFKRPKMINPDQYLKLLKALLELSSGQRLTHPVASI